MSPNRKFMRLREPSRIGIIPLMTPFQRRNRMQRSIRIILAASLMAALLPAAAFAKGAPEGAKSQEITLSYMYWGSPAEMRRPAARSGFRSGESRHQGIAHLRSRNEGRIRRQDQDHVRIRTRCPTWAISGPKASTNNAAADFFLIWIPISMGTASEPVSPPDLDQEQRQNCRSLYRRRSPGHVLTTSRSSRMQAFPCRPPIIRRPGPGTRRSRTGRS
jgi:hypothetical protein